MGLLIWICGVSFLLGMFVSDDPIQKVGYQVTAWLCFIGATIIWRMPPREK